MVRRLDWLFLLLTLTGAASAQEADVAGLRASLAGVRDIAELQRFERAHEQSEAVADQLAAGFVALRLWQVTGERQHAARARGYFDAAASLDPDCAWAHYGHALSLQPDIDGGPGALVADDVFGRALGMDARSRARRALERAVVLDPTLPGAAELLGRLAAETRDDSAARLAREALVAAASAENASDAVLLALARTARQQGEYGSAAEAAGRVVERADSSYALASLELALALASLDNRRADAATAYEEAVAFADDSLLARLWDDVALIRNEADQSRWESASTVVARRAVLRSFWELRGALAGLSAGERAADHYARLNYAWLHLRRWGVWGAAPLNAYRFEKLDARFADQGIIYIRHGPPDHVWESRDRDYVVWYYRDQEGGPLSYHFIRYHEAGWSQDPILVRLLPCMDPEVALYDPRLRPLTYGCNSMRIASVSADVREDVARALRTDSDMPRFGQELPFHFDLYTFLAQSGTELVAGVGVPLAEVPAGERSLRFTLALVDTARYTTARTSASGQVPRRPPAPATGEVSVQASSNPQALLRTWLSMLVAPSPPADYRIGVEDSGRQAGMTYGGTIAIPDYSGSELRLSDIVLAEPDSTGSFVRGPYRLALAPAQLFPGGRFRVFYELYHLLPGQAYTTEISIERARRGLLSRLLGRGRPVALRFEEIAPDPVATTWYQLRDVTAPLAPGEYVMRVRIRAADVVAERTRRFTVPGR